LGNVDFSFDFSLWTGHEARIEGKKNACKVFMGKSKRKGLLVT